MSIATMLVTDADRRRLGSSLEKAAGGRSRHHREFVALETDLEFASNVLAEEVPGEVVQVAVPAGPRRIRIERLRYQPERVGHFDR